MDNHNNFENNNDTNDIAFDEKLKNVLADRDVPEHLLPENIKDSILSKVTNMTAKHFLIEIKHSKISFSHFMDALEQDEKFVDIASEIKQNPQISAEKMLALFQNASLSGLDYYAVLSAAKSMQKKSAFADTQPTREIEPPQYYAESSRSVRASEPDDDYDLNDTATKAKPKAVKKHWGKRITALATAAAVLVGGICLGNMYLNPSDNPLQAKEYPNGYVTAGVDNPEPKVDDYTLLYDNLKEYYEQQQKEAMRDSINNFFDGAFGKVEYDMAAPEADEDTIAGDASKDDSFNSDSLNQTEGVSEADIIQFDGKRFYYLNDMSGTVKVLLPTENGMSLEGEIKPDIKDSYYILDLVLSENRLAVIYSINYNTYRTNGAEIAIDSIYGGHYAYNANVYVEIYDTAKPLDKPVSTYKQQGQYTTLRVKGNYLYLISGYTPQVSGTFDKEKFETVIPTFEQNGKSSKVAPADICLPERINNVSYSIISGLDLNNSTPLVSIKADLNYTGSVYASANNIYLASSQYEYTESYSRNYTTFTKLSYADGKISMLKKADEDGYLINQYAMDEYKDFFRVALTVDNYVLKQGTTTSNMTTGRYSVVSVFDKDMVLTDRTEKLAKGESIQSVRFDGDIGYVVTFLQRDPLFSIDLSDPHNILVKDALKIDGYSTYMQKWSDDLLLGFGVDTDSDGNVLGLKLSMFDVKDKENLSELHKMPIHEAASNWLDSEATYNQKALYVSKDKNLIGVPYQFHNGVANTNKYLLFKYDETEGFVKLGEISDASYDTFKRGGALGNIYYIFAERSVYAINLETKKVVGKTTLPTTQNSNDFGWDFAIE